MWCWRQVLGISWQEHLTDELVLDELNTERELIAKVALLKLQYCGHVARESQLALTVLQRIMEEEKPKNTTCRWMTSSNGGE